MFPSFHRALLATYLRPQWPRVLLLSLLLFAGIGLQLANPQVARVFIDQAQAGEPLDHLLSIAIIFLGVAIGAQFVTVAETYAAESLGWQTTNALRLDLVRHVLQLDHAFHAEHTAGELIERIDGDVSAIADFFARFVVGMLGNCVFLAGVLILLYLEDWRIGALLSVATLAALVLMTRAGNLLARRSRAARQAAADLSSCLEEQLEALADIKTSGADAYAMRRLHARLARSFATAGDSAMAAALFNGGVGLVFLVGTGAALAVCLVLYGGGAITLGGIYVVFRYTVMLRQPLERLARQMNRFQTATGGIVRVRELLSTRPRIVDGPGAAVPPGPLSVELEDVTFAYATESVLQQVSWCLAPGELLGLIGRTGSGKTTISRLLFRLHDPTSGSVRMGGTEIRNMRLEDLRSRVVLVTQDVQLFQTTLRDNVSVFDPGVSDQELIEVFGELGLHAWLAALPDGLHTLIGPAGRGVSAGEAQLIALARAFLKQPDLVILDEASSRLDPTTERLLDRALDRLLAGRTGVIIAHRLATVERVDKILIIDDGCVAEIGPRADLARDPESRFARLLRIGIAEALA